MILDIKVIREKEKLENKEYMEPTLRALEQHFDLDMAEIRSYVASHEKSAYYVLAKRLPYEQISSFQEAMDAQDSLIRGVWFEKEYKRYYPMGTLACDVIGFTSSDNVGAYGLEAYYNEELNGLFRSDIFLGLVALLVHHHTADQRVRIAGVVQIIDRVAGHSQNISRIDLHYDTSHILSAVSRPRSILMFLVKLFQIFFHDPLELSPVM